MKCAAWLPFLVLGSFASIAVAEDDKPEAVLSAAMAAVERGAFDEAVDRLELLSDRGFVHPDASAARAFAYIERARSRNARPGNLGRAAAALEEAHLLRADDDEVVSAIERVQSEIARRRTRQGGSPVVQRPTLARAMVGLLPENTWAVLAAVGSVVLSVGLVLYQGVKRRGAEIAGAVGIVTGLLLGVLGGALAAASRHYRTISRPAVVVVPEARLLDDGGRPLRIRGGNDGIPEGALVYVREQKDDRSRVEWGTVDGWIRAAELRLLATSTQTPP